MFITYFIGTIFYFISTEFNTEKDQDTGMTFNKVNNMSMYESNIKRLVVVLYFALTTLSTVGYGDKVPISNVERISVIFFMIGGIMFFTYIMSMFNYMIMNFKAKMG